MVLISETDPVQPKVDFLWRLLSSFDIELPNSKRKTLKNTNNGIKKQKEGEEEKKKKGKRKKYKTAVCSKKQNIQSNIPSTSRYNKS
ncbi:hypothetical protein XELAEV_18002740mg [Xenopus laevis]|nr:hypothetical protein XELAEV_18002740mg [Xenopus laevis]